MDKILKRISVKRITNAQEHHDYMVGAAGFEPAKTLYNMSVSLIIIVDTAR
jgi:hypothetical protein